jgi:hypothetical protein
MQGHHLSAEDNNIKKMVKYPIFTNSGIISLPAERTIYSSGLATFAIAMPDFCKDRFIVDDISAGDIGVVRIDFDVVNRNFFVDLIDRVDDDGLAIRIG